LFDCEVTSENKWLFDATEKIELIRGFVARDDRIIPFLFEQFKDVSNMTSP
jgi:hypothetical protein